MNQYRSHRFQALREIVIERLADTSWAWGKRWGSRVGLPRTVAEDAAVEASSLLRSINRNTHRNQPELDSLLLDARVAVRDYATAIGRDNWLRFEGEI